MFPTRKLTENEERLIFTINSPQYEGRKIINFFTEFRGKHPSEENLDINNVGMALLIERGATDLYHKVRSGEVECWVDSYCTILEKPDGPLGWVIAVTILEK
jgi:hypothetical protein